MILSDFSLPGFSGATALEIAQERCPHIPFIIMSGVLGDAELGPGDYVCVSASDTGAGMEPEVLEHALEPFFTTKPFAAGGGLGLASVYGIVRQAGGTVNISSAPGAGTTVTAWLRAVTSDLATSTGAPASIGQPAS